MEPHWIYYWRVTEATGRRYTTRHRATEEEVRSQHPTARAFERVDAGALHIRGEPLRAHSSSFGDDEMSRYLAAGSPRFEPGTGWYRHGQLSPGTPAEVEARRRAALPCVIYPMRLRGERRPLAELIDLAPHEGALVLNDDFTKPHWHAMLYDLPGMTIPVLGMHEATVVRCRGGFRQIRGIEWGEKAMVRWPQTWFCAPSVEAARGVLAKMGTP